MTARYFAVVAMIARYLKLACFQNCPQWTWEHFLGALESHDNLKLSQLCRMLLGIEYCGKSTYSVSISHFLYRAHSENQ